MAGEIINRIENSKLVTIDLEDFYPKGKRFIIDIKDWLFQELILRERDFREQIKDHNWSRYKDCYVALTCTSDAIIPSWAYLLLTTKLTLISKKVVVGNIELLETVLFQKIIENLDVSNYRDKSIIIKGCSNKLIPASAYAMLIGKVLPIAKTIMYGEACSTVPLYKIKKH